MMLALVMTLITLATISVLFVYRRNNANLRSSMADKINSLQTLLEARCRFAQDYTAFNTQEALGVLEDISNTTKQDITLYTTGGKEFRSTTPEVFDRMLLGTRMNQEAFENIIYRNRRYYIGKEKIGSTQTYFLYAPIFNAQGKMIAIMGSPYTDESFDFKSEAVSHSITIITMFIILLLLARFFMERAVDKMFKPITEIGKKMNEVDINNLEYIVYERDDEVSTLVRAYNLMVHDLYNSTKQLTQAERDKAWATMARQVAHEIKNPLTPIKLQIQRLIRMKSNGNPAWAERFDEVSEEVLKQIDLLADTANEFSTFAKLYTEEPVEIDLDKLLKEEIDLFDSRDNITFSYMGLDGAKVIGPKPQLTRVFVNLIGNSVQAIENAQNEVREKGEEPFMGQILVSLRLSNKEGFYDIVFEDNHLAPTSEEVEIGGSPHEVSLTHCSIFGGLGHIFGAVFRHFVDERVGHRNHHIERGPCQTEVFRKAGELEACEFSAYIRVPRVVGTLRSHTEHGTAVEIEPSPVVERLGSLPHCHIGRIERRSCVLVKRSSVEEVLTAAAHGERHCCHSHIFE